MAKSLQTSIKGRWILSGGSFMLSVRYTFVNDSHKLKQMAAQQLINAFMKLTSKAGAGDLVREMIQAIDENGNPKEWTEEEMSQAVAFVNMQVERFGKNEAIQVIQTLMKKYNVSTGDLTIATDTLDETPGVQGLL